MLLPTRMRIDSVNEYITSAPIFFELLHRRLDQASRRIDSADAKAKDAMKSFRPGMPVGFNLAMSDDQPAPEDSISRKAC
jgi:hypothetical protein